MESDRSSQSNVNGEESCEADEGAADSSPFSFTVDDAKRALSDILSAFHNPQNATKLNEASTAAGDDMVKHMQLVFPMATDMQLDVITKYGFQKGGDGLIRFVQMIKAYEEDDPEIGQLFSQVKAMLMPPMLSAS
ncbi:unnamed protein product [Darwinula stevensoni]|uniref:Protein C10 n=1 Tax=Darwinula stevensoni TaxID=69355 RepID=A0A7R8ZY75_9CRUS|nr:unnamed protein product [Darwinula stevensoni]CAG0880973.1 unnamed protein product [Darwinula stevensoni]